MGHPVLRAKALPVPPSEIHVRAHPAADRRHVRDHARIRAALAWRRRRSTRALRIFVAGVRAADVVDADDRRRGHAVHHADQPGDHAGRRADVDTGWEGCLSIPDIRGMVPRATAVRVRALRPRRAAASSSSRTGLPARVIQHETDHLDGVLFFDRMTSFETLTFMDEFRRYWAEGRRRVTHDCTGVHRAEAAALAPYFTNLDRPVFALVNLPETVKGALFARYSRSPKSLRRLFLDEFCDQVAAAARRAGRRRSASSAPSGCTRTCSTSTATTRSRSSAASTWRSRTRRTS